MSSKGGEGDGPGQRGKHGSDGDDDDKVVRLPRDWLGPREELVPFGPSAEGDDRKSEEPASVPDEREVSSSPPEPVSPDDFWGERSASLQGPLDEADRDAASEPRRRRARVVGAVAAAVVAVAVLVVSLIGETSGPGKVHVSAGLNRGGARGALRLLPALMPPAGHRPSSNRDRSKTKRSGRSRPAGTVAVNYVREPSSSQSAASGGGGSGTGSSGTAPSNTGSTPASSGGGTPTPSPQESTPPPSNSSGSSRPASKTPPFGADGALGPGHSPSG